MAAASVDVPLAAGRWPLVRAGPRPLPSPQVLVALTNGVGAFYARFVEHAAPNALAVRLWRFLVTGTFLRRFLLDFFDQVSPAAGFFFDILLCRLLAVKALCVWWCVWGGGGHHAAWPHCCLVYPFCPPTYPDSSPDLAPHFHFCALLAPAASQFTDFSKRLTSFKANGKFERGRGRSFGDFVAGAKRDFGLDLVYCWHALPG